MESLINCKIEELREVLNKEEFTDDDLPIGTGILNQVLMIFENNKYELICPPYVPVCYDLEEKVNIPNELDLFAKKYLSSDEVDYMIIPYCKKDGVRITAPIGLQIDSSNKLTFDETQPIELLLKNKLKSKPNSNELINDCVDELQWMIKNNRNEWPNSQINIANAEKVITQVSKLENELQLMKENMIEKFKVMKDELTEKLDKVKEEIINSVKNVKSMEMDIKYPAMFGDVFEQTVHTGPEFYKCAAGELRVIEYKENNFNNKLGTLIVSMDYVSDNCIYPYSIVVKDKTQDVKWKSINSIELISNRSGLQILGITNVLTGMGSYSILGDLSDGYPGYMQGKYGSINRYISTGNSELIDIVNTVTQKFEQGLEFVKVIKFAVEQLIIMFQHLCPFKANLRPYGKYSIDCVNKVSNSEFLKIKEEFKTIKLNDALLKSVISCAKGCILLRDERKNMMYGSRVIYRDKKYHTPCGLTVGGSWEYYRHPCTVRARAVGLYDPDVNAGNFVSKNFVGVEANHACSLCGRLYTKNIDKFMCALFCVLIARGAVVHDKLTTNRSDIKPFGNYGEVITDEDMPSIFEMLQLK